MKSYPECLESIGLSVVGKFKNSNTHTKMQCLICGDKFEATPKSKMQNYKKHGMKGCPKCTHKKRYADSKEANIQQLNDMGFKLITEYTDRNCEITVINLNCGCGREFTASAGNLLNGVSFCRPCNDDEKRKRMQHWNDYRSKNALSRLSGFKHYRKHVRILSEIVYRDHKDILTENGKLKRERGGYHLDHIMPITFCYKNNIPAEVCADISNLQLMPETDNISKGKTIVSKIPKIFKPYLSSAKILSNFVNIIQSSISSDMECWKDFTFFEVPVFFSEQKLALILVSFDLYQEQNLKNKFFIRALYQKFNDMGVECIFIMEDEWLNNQDLIVDKILHILGENSSQKVYARNCDVIEITSDQKAKFLNEFHIQGNDASNINLGLVYDNELVSVMTFSKPKIFMKGASTQLDGQYELSRFSNTSKYRIVGSFSKLLSYFRKNFNFDTIYSFADLRWGSGNLYKVNGFDLVDEVTPDYSYVINGERKHRWGFRKDRLREKYPDVYKKECTEYETMLKLGYDRIWDCGKLKFELRNK